MKAFMSSKVSKLRQESTNDEQRPKYKQEIDEDRNNAYNDAMLHRMVHTKLLSGSLSEDISLKPAARRKAMEGRLLELTGSSKLGKGENIIRKGERNKASTRVRKGLQDKVQERRKEKLEEAKDLGNYHRSLKRVYEDEDADRPKKKRDRGLSMGVGRFSGGVLKLSRDDIAKATGTSGRGRGGGSRGRGASTRGRGSSGRGGKRGKR
ncbi:hypothetical protein BDV98DRAFT_560617 [Pterulicium gracile]|uniref:Uncharacterized protein n=1 Tax=Pterulicium gracile TaxID=1884261 RepID=A0A5C3QYA6_9AGAR|nr:hypothetical protein BDV98DRAFT_560617 [Pterula gracilis]